MKKIITQINLLFKPDNILSAPQLLKWKEWEFESVKKNACFYFLALTIGYAAHIIFIDIYKDNLFYWIGTRISICIISLLFYFYTKKNESHELAFVGVLSVSYLVILMQSSAMIISTNSSYYWPFIPILIAVSILPLKTMNALSTMILSFLTIYLFFIKSNYHFSIFISCLLVVIGLICVIKKAKQGSLQLFLKEEELHEKNKSIAIKDKELFQSKKMAALGTIAIGVAHELRNPLAFLEPMFNKSFKLNLALEEIINSGNLEKETFIVLDNKYKIDKFLRKKDFIKTSYSSAIDRMNFIINSLGSQNISENNIKMENQNLHELILNTIEIIKESRKDALETNFITILDKNVIFPCNKHEIIQVLTNLINNSLDEIKQKDSKQISVSLKNHPEKVDITIEDSGDGVPKAKINSIFEPFFTTKDIGEGSGLGLWLCLSIIERNNGSIKASNSPKYSGALFKITLNKY